MQQLSPRPRRRLEGGQALVASVLLVACGTPATVEPGDGSTPSPTTAQAATSASGVTLAVEGYSLPVPRGWTVQGRSVIGTAFEQEALRCDSAEAVDRPVPSDAGSAQLARAAVQICVIARDDDLSLEQWLAGRSQGTSTPDRYGTCEVRVLPGTPERQLVYAQSPGLRAEIAVTVTTTPEKTPQRLREVAGLLTQLRCPPT